MARFRKLVGVALFVALCATIYATPAGAATVQGNGHWYGQFTHVSASQGLGAFSYRKALSQEYQPGRYTPGDGAYSSDPEGGEWYRTLTFNSSNGAGKEVGVIGGTAIDSFDASVQPTELAFVSQFVMFSKGSPAGGSPANQYVTDFTMTFTVPAWRGLSSATVKANRIAVPGSANARYTRPVFMPGATFVEQTEQGEDVVNSPATLSWIYRVVVVATREDTATDEWVLTRYISAQSKKGNAGGTVYGKQQVTVSLNDPPYDMPGLTVGNSIDAQNPYGMHSFPCVMLGESMNTGLWFDGFTIGGGSLASFNSVAQMNGSASDFVPNAEDWLGNPLDPEDTDNGGGGSSLAPPGGVAADWGEWFGKLKDNMEGFVGGFADWLWVLNPWALFTGE